MTNSIHNPHDHFFKSAMSDLRVAKDFLEQHFPVDVKSLVNFDTLEFHKETYIDAGLKLSAADVVYSAQIDNSLGYIYVLVEQQTNPDKKLPLRLMRYIWNLIEDHDKTHQADELPLVYPMIFYNGSQRYNFSTNIFDLFGQRRDLMKRFINDSFQLIDLMEIPDEDLREHIWCGILEYVVKHRNLAELIHIAEAVKWLHQLEQIDGYDYAKVVVYYMINQLDGHGVRTLIETIKRHLSKQLGDETMTLAQLLIQEGMQQGMQQGMLQGQHALLEYQLKHKFKIIPTHYQRMIETADEQDLLTWGSRLIDAKSLEDVFDRSCTTNER